MLPSGTRQPLYSSPSNQQVLQAPQAQSTRVQQSTNPELINITNLLNNAPDPEDCVDILKACRNYLGCNGFTEESYLTSDTFKQKEVELLELALEFYSNKNQDAATIIARAISVCYPPGSNVNGEVDFYLVPRFQNQFSKGFVMSLQFAANCGRKVAQFVLGELYKEGKFVEQNYKMASFYFQKSAHQGYQPAIDALNDLPISKYSLAHDCEKSDLTKAFLLYKQAAAEGDVDAMFRLGELYLNAKDKINALKFFKLAFDAGHKQASFYFAEVSAAQYKEATFKFINTDSLTDALKYYDLTAQVGGIKSAEAAFKYLELKADYLGDINAQCQLGKLYLTGISSPHPNKNADNAEKYLKLAADAGHGEAAYILSGEYDYDAFNFTCPNPEKLSSHYHNIAAKAGYLPAVLEKAAVNGDIAAAEKLYQLHTTGDASISLPANEEKAVKYLLIATETKATAELKIQVEAEKKAREVSTQKDKEVAKDKQPTPFNNDANEGL